MELQDFIKQYRKEKHLTMQEFADRCGLSKGYISMLESGKHPQSQRPIVPSIETYGKIAAGMNMQLDELLRAIDGESIVGVGKGSDFDFDIQFFAAKENPAENDGISEKDLKLLEWFRSLPPEKQRAILFSQDAPEGLA